MLDSLYRRPRGRKVAPVLNRLSKGLVASPPLKSCRGTHKHGSADECIEWDPAQRDLFIRNPPHGRVTEILHNKLAAEDIRGVEEALAGDDLALWESLLPEHRKALTLAFGVHYGVAGVLKKTGLSQVLPPPDVHAMSTFSTDSGGDYYSADLVDEALSVSGVRLENVSRGLDFGCSSGRAVRVLKTAFPELELHGCDPNQGAIDWAKENLPGIHFYGSENRPPLEYEDESFDFVYAISIWSHFAEDAALMWLEEMRRIIRPGGHLVFTTHGWETLRHFARHERWLTKDIKKAAMDLYGRGYSYWDVFGKEGDHGIVDPEWGMSLFTPDWILAKLLPTWLAVAFMPGRNSENQDVFVLRRK